MNIYTHSHIYVCIKYCLSHYKELMCLVPMGSLKNALKPKRWSLKQMMPTNSYGRKLFFSLHVYIYAYRQDCKARTQKNLCRILSLTETNKDLHRDTRNGMSKVPEELNNV